MITSALQTTVRQTRKASPISSSGSFVPGGSRSLSTVLQIRP